ncbi:uncharacterized protein LOC126971481 [Leptidea sinapis]|uniref:uncharacterized protein LOC126971481 n=1 Tax=Leptidea sinapis TaxID=189913 RepID=UPI00213DBDE5|nr:uncharacterized protein LOC126971481 [Leptidea sinapis]
MDKSGVDYGALKETLKNVDIVSMLKAIVSTSPEDAESEDIRGKIEGVIKRYNEMTDREKEMFMEQLRDALATKLALNMREAAGDEGFPLTYVIAALLLGVIFVFFGYKLYKSIKEKDLKREEKRKAKLMKKKK